MERNSRTPKRSRMAAIQCWWEQPCGGREVLAVSLPLLVSTASWSLQTFVDRMFLLWHRPEAMAATLSAGMLYWNVICFPVGVASFLNTFVAQYTGAGRSDRIGAATWQGIYFGLLCTPLFGLLFPLVPYIFGQAGRDPDIAALEQTYFEIMLFGAGGAVVAAAMTSFFSGRGVTRIVMEVDVLALFLNALLNYCWIFGHAGFPAWGMAGAAWGTVIAQWSKVGVLACLMLRRSTREEFHLWPRAPFDWPLTRRLLYFGSPSGLQMWVESFGFAILCFLVGRLGKTAMTATSLALNVNLISFVPLVGISIATSTLVGQQLARDRPDLAERTTWTSFALAAVYTSIFGVLFVAAPDLFLLGHAAGADPVQFGEIRDLAVVLLRFVAAYCMFDAVQMVFVGAIKGAGDTWYVLVATAVVSVAGVVAAWFALRWGILAWWCVLTGWVLAVAALFFARFLQGAWKSMRVVESV